ncbi:MAG: hypothetical protein ACRC45_06000 [Cetobacterium sp.]
MNDNTKHENASYENTSYEQSQNDVINNSDYAELAKSLTQKNEEQSSNIIKQREIIDNTFAEKKNLEAEVERLRKEMEAIKNATASYNQVSPDRIKNLEDTLGKYETEKREQAFIPVLETMKEFGVQKNEVGNVIEQVQKQYGVDLRVTPNVELLKFALGSTQKTEPNTVPSGGYVNHNTSQPASDAEYQAKLDAYMAERKAAIARQYGK